MTSIDAVQKLVEEAAGGKWTIDDRGSAIHIDADLYFIAEIDTSYDNTGFDRAKCEANARLIAAAPQLAQALVEAWECLERIEMWAEDEVLNGPPELGLILGESRTALARLREMELGT